MCLLGYTTASGQTATDLKSVDVSGEPHLPQ